MKINHVSTFTCEICEESYGTAEKALDCETKPVTGDKGAKVGNIVKITAGEGTGKLATVWKIGVHSKGWGHYQWERYWHTVFVVANLVDDTGSRTLSFDDYELA